MHDRFLELVPPENLHEIQHRVYHLFDWAWVDAQYIPMDGIIQPQKRLWDDDKRRNNAPLRTRAPAVSATTRRWNINRGACLDDAALATNRVVTCLNSYSRTRMDGVRLVSKTEPPTRLSVYPQHLPKTRTAIGRDKPKGADLNWIRRAHY